MLDATADGSALHPEPLPVAECKDDDRTSRLAGTVAPQSGRPHSGGLPDRAPGSLVKYPGSKRPDAHTQLVWAENTSRKHDTAL